MIELTNQKIDKLDIDEKKRWLTWLFKIEITQLLEQNAKILILNLS